MYKRLIFALILTAASFAWASEDRIVPLTVGNRWEYVIEHTGVMSVGEGADSRSVIMRSTGRNIEEVVSVKELRRNGDVVYEHRSATTTEEGLNTQASRSVIDALMLVSGKGIAVVGSRTSGEDRFPGGEWMKHNPPIVMFGAGMSPGKSWKVGTLRDGDLRMPMQARVNGYETVTVPAGTFEDCIKVYVTCSKVTGAMGEGDDKAVVESGKSVNRLWVYPGVGVVKEENILQVKMHLEQDDSDRPVRVTNTQRKTKYLLPGYRAE